MAIGAGAGCGRATPDAALHICGLDNNENAKPGLILRAEDYEIVATMAPAPSIHETPHFDRE
jgi:hypothetical protein